MNQILKKKRKRNVSFTNSSTDVYYIIEHFATQSPSMYIYTHSYSFLYVIRVWLKENLILSGMRV